MNFLRKHILVVRAVLIGLLILIVGLSIKIFIPFKSDRTGQTIVTIERGQSLISVSRELQKEGVIDSPFLFRILVTLRGKENSLPAGFYMFDDARVSLNEIVRRLSTGDSGFKAVRLTVPEGLNVIEVAQKVNEVFPAITDFASSAKSYEGYLFPDTYYFMPYATTTEILNKMQITFEKKVLNNEKFNQAVASSGHSLSDIVKMASILEGEVKTIEDRKIVSDLLWRRIKDGMPLQVDATFSYINQKTSAQLTTEDLKIDSLYNTYKYKGLPPTPISNPGIETLMAAAEPTPNSYVYFLNDKDGVSHFSKTYAEHLRLKNRYLK